MSTTDDLARLAELHRLGQLTDAEFVRAKARVIDGVPAASGSPVLQAVNGLRLSATDRWLGGVCGGLARTTAIDAWIWRLAFTLLALWGGSGVVAYLLMWIFVPREPVASVAQPRLGA